MLPSERMSENMHSLYSTFLELEGFEPSTSSLQMRRSRPAVLQPQIVLSQILKSIQYTYVYLTI